MTDIKNVNPLLLPIVMDSETIRKTVLANIIKMLRYRNHLDIKKWSNSKITSFVKPYKDDAMYSVKLDSPIKSQMKPGAKSKFVGDIVYIKIISQKVKSVNNIPILNDFIKSYSNYHKIIIFDDIPKKAVNQLKNYKNIEVFKQPFFMIDLMSLDNSPDYEILSADDAKKVKEEYIVTNKTMSVMFYNDAASLYLGLSPGQMVRIIRRSENSLSSIGYRIVKV